ncbi:hypothetical protein [Methylosinus sp. Sm6]|uniref:hypothetical protein n=1 Tax=Methylosinus sp. Sm6 TaxID=2866948 RepID=UPI001C994DB3|nr:hypothetical protein [Methylosinus sp. Sm6]MBY6242825.1 hypothetical protein [Methylosinus sp. Sm6]
MNDRVRLFSLAEQIRGVEAAARVATGRERPPARAAEREYGGDILAAAVRTLRWVRQHEGEIRTAVAGSASAPAPAAAAERGKPCEFPLARRAAMRCAERAFQKFLGADTAEGAAEAVRRRCGVASRKDFDRDAAARARWRDLEAEFQAWRRCADDGDARPAA